MIEINQTKKDDPKFSIFINRCDSHLLFDFAKQGSPCFVIHKFKHFLRQDKCSYTTLRLQVHKRK